MDALVVQILTSAFNLQLPFFGFSFGIMIVTFWSLPLIVKFIKSIFG